MARTAPSAAFLAFGCFSLFLVVVRHTKTFSSRLGHDKKPLDRYSRQKLILGWDGQAGVRAGSVLVVGCGGLASGCIPMLAGAGVSTIGLVDDDFVDLLNLHRQTIHSESFVDQPKVISAKNFISKLNSEISVQIFHERVVSLERMLELMSDYSVVIDCTDNLEARYLINHACVLLGKPLVSASALATFGQVGVFWPSRLQKGCFECLFPKSQKQIEGSCSNDGVLGPIPNVIGSLQALECLKLLAFYLSERKVNDGSSSFKTGENLLCLELDCLNERAFERISLKKRKNCPICSNVEPKTDHTNSKDDNVVQVVEIQSDWFVLLVGKGLKFGREDEVVTLEELRREELRDTVMSELEKKISSKKCVKICCVCKSGISSRVAARILNARFKDSGLQFLSLEGGVENLKL